MTDEFDFHLCYAPDGRPISVREWAELMSRRFEDMSDDSWWRRRTDVDGLVVSTVWTGANSNLFGPPLFWETIIVGLSTCESHVWRYTSRSWALDDHEEIVRELRHRRNEFEASLRERQWERQ